MHSHVHCSVMHNSQDIETNYVSISGWMDKENVVYTYNGILFSYSKDGNPDICKNMDEPWVYPAKWSKQDTERKILHDLTYMHNLKKSNS